MSEMGDNFFHLQQYLQREASKAFDDLSSALPKNTYEFDEVLGVMELVAMSHSGQKFARILTVRGLKGDFGPDFLAQFVQEEPTQELIANESAQIQGL